MEPITYSLRAGQMFSDAYYQEISAFTSEVLTQVESCLLPTIQSFRDAIEASGGEPPRTVHEYAFELLVLGVLWRRYAPAAAGVPPLPQHALRRMAALRKQHPTIKPVVDPLRGILARLFLVAPHRNHSVPTTSLTVPNLETLEQLLDWLAASGDFQQEVLRLRAWHGFLAQHGTQDAGTMLAACIQLGDWFATRSNEVLGCYTPNVDRFLIDTHLRYRWREDAIFCGRQRVEYHLGMVGTEVLNQAFRQAFLATERKVLLVPPCMCQPEAECKAQPTPFGACCAHCSPGCRVNQLTRLGEKQDFGVFILPDELSIFSTSGPSPQAVRGLGIVGVSCVLTNLRGGWEVRQMGVPAQGIPLDYCGCKWHWHDQGIPTDINFHQLFRVMGVEAGSKASFRKMK